METIVSVLKGTYIQPPPRWPPRWSSSEEREKYYDDCDNQTKWYHNATLDDLNSRTDEEWNNLIEFETGFTDLFYNKNVSLMDTEKLLHVLEIMKTRKQRFFDDVFYYVLLYPLSIREWVVKHLEPNRTNELYIEDRENY